MVVRGERHFVPIAVLRPSFLSAHAICQIFECVRKLGVACEAAGRSSPPTPQSYCVPRSSMRAHVGSVQPAARPTPEIQKASGCAPKMLEISALWLLSTVYKADCVNVACGISMRGNV